MAFLRDCWRRTPLCRFLDGLDHTDRLTFWVAAVLSVAFGLAWSYIAHAEANAPPPDPWFELPDTVIRFASLGGRA